MLASIPDRLQRETPISTRMARLLFVALALTVPALVLTERNRAPVAAAPLITLEEIASGLSRPLSIVDAGDGSGRLFIVEQTGAVKIRHANGSISTFINLASKISCCTGERGLLDIAFHPDYETNGYFFVNYTDLAGDTVIERYSVTANPNVGDPNSGVLILTFEQPDVNHNGGDLVFGPDGYLYIGSGDGGGSGDPGNNGQNLSILLGKILRIDVSGALPYEIPPENPTAQTGADEILAYGLRNPWRLSFDALTGELYIADVGQGTREEVNVVAAGDSTLYNYGWNVMEGSLCFNPPTGCDPRGLTLPAFEYEHADGNCSITGGYVHRGSIAALYGAYIFGDFCSGRIWEARNQAGTWQITELLDTSMLISTFGEDAARGLYVADWSGGRVYRIVEYGPDADGDGLADNDDNCPAIANPAQEDTDADAFGDACEVAAGTNPLDADTDDDGCEDGREALVLQFPPTLGGDRDPLSFWDFFDVPAPALLPGATGGVRSGAVSLADVLAVLRYAGTTAGGPANAHGADYDSDLNANGMIDGQEYDRTQSLDPAKPWRSGAPSGTINLSDALVALAQAGHSCI